MGIFWINLAKSNGTEPLPYGLHGTSIPDQMNIEESIGGFRYDKLGHCPSCASPAIGHASGMEMRDVVTLGQTRNFLGAPGIPELSPDRRRDDSSCRRSFLADAGQTLGEGET